METTTNSNFLCKSLQTSDGSQILSPVKPSLLPVDLFELVRQNSNYASSHVSTYDTTSSSAEDDTTKSIIFESNSPSSPLEETEVMDEKMTLKEIISKRYHQKKPKKKADVKQLDVTPWEKRKLDRTLIDVEEKISKKEKLNSGETLSLVRRTENLYAVPRLVLKNGKTLLDTSFDASFENELKTLEIVPEKKKLTTSNSFRNINHSEKWTEEETTRFYRALELFGTDFTLITKLFPNRNRNQIKNKFLKEEKVSKEKVDDVFSKKNNSKLQKLFTKANKILKLTYPVQDGQFPEKCIIQTNKSRSGSFHSTSSMDSLDVAIIGDLSDMMKNPSC
jgi:uncharacterized protein (DUF2132 family)